MYKDNLYIFFSFAKTKNGTVVDSDMPCKLSVDDSLQKIGYTRINT